MGFPRDLDEYTEDELRKELERRHSIRLEGRCDYCGRRGDTEPCRYTQRHRLAERHLTTMKLSQEPIT